MDIPRCLRSFVGMRAAAVAFVALLLVCGGTTLQAQELEYKMEVGGAVGGCFYLGDANSTAYKNTGLQAAAIARYNLNPRMVVKANLAMGHISGNSDGYFFPTDPNSHSAEGGQLGKASFSRNVYDLGAQYEYNFWAYGTGAGYKDSRRLTPYILLGMGFTFAPKPAKNVIALNFPLGAGIKYKLRPRLNLGFEWSIRFTTSDQLDVSKKEGVALDSPYGIKSGMFKNKDCYSFTMIYLTYDICPKYRKCNN
jgi:hypothetical protein